MVAFESWSKALLQLDRGGAHARPVQGVTFQGQVHCIRGVMGFFCIHHLLPLEDLSLSLYQDAALFISFISFLKVSGWEDLS